MLNCIKNNLSGRNAHAPTNIVCHTFFALHKWFWMKWLNRKKKVKNFKRKSATQRLQQSKLLNCNYFPIEVALSGEKPLGVLQRSYFWRLIEEWRLSWKGIYLQRKSNLYFCNAIRRSDILYVVIYNRQAEEFVSFCLYEVAPLKLKAFI